MACKQHAREKTDKLPAQAGWKVLNDKDANIHAGRGVAIREFPLKTGHGFADYLLYVEGKAAGVIETKKSGSGKIFTAISIVSRLFKALPTALHHHHG